MFHFTMTYGDPNILILNDHVSLPIIISDYDAIQANKEEASEHAQHRSHNRQDSVSTTESEGSTIATYHWTTGFGQYLDECWSRMTDHAKRKLRDACGEVLRRTDDTAEDGVFSRCDDDARMLD